MDNSENIDKLGQYYCEFENDFLISILHVEKESDYLHKIGITAKEFITNFRDKNFPCIPSKDQQKILSARNINNQFNHEQFYPRKNLDYYFVDGKFRFSSFNLSWEPRFYYDMSKTKVSITRNFISELTCKTREICYDGYQLIFISHWHNIFFKRPHEILKKGSSSSNKFIEKALKNEIIIKSMTEKTGKYKAEKRMRPVSSKNILYMNVSNLNCSSKRKFWNKTFSVR